MSDVPDHVPDNAPGNVSDDVPDDVPGDVPGDLLELLRCPACRGEFAHPGAAPQSMTCSACGLRYPVRGGVPILLVDEAAPTRDDG